MADLAVDTTAPAYATRRQQFSDIVGFYGPRLKFYFQLSSDDKREWRQNDPFLRDILDFSRKIEAKKHEEL